MTAAKREEMFSKDYLTIKDVQELLDLSYGDAAKLIRQIRRKTDRLGIQGKIHVQDYIDYYNLDIKRYMGGQNNEQATDAV